MKKVETFESRVETFDSFLLFFLKIFLIPIKIREAPPLTVAPHRPQAAPRRGPGSGVPPDAHPGCPERAPPAQLLPANRFIFFLHVFFTDSLTE